jgi:hypothetical protein
MPLWPAWPLDLTDIDLKPGSHDGLPGLGCQRVPPSRRREELPMAINHPDEIQKFQALTVFNGIKFLLKHGWPVHPSHTEKNLAAAASAFTGMDYKKGQLKDAEADLRLWFSDICNYTVDAVPIEYPED